MVKTGRSAKTGGMDLAFPIIYKNSESINHILLLRMDILERSSPGRIYNRPIEEDSQTNSCGRSTVFGK